jgi:replicative DNA helicase
MVNKGFDYRHYVHTPAELAREYVQWAEMLKETPGIPFGVPAIDEHVLPAHPGDVISFIGRPGHGKSSLLAWFALQQAGRITARGALGSEAVVYVTYEQAAEELEMFFQMGGTYKNSDLARGKVDLELVRERSLARASLPIWTIGHGLGRVDPRAPRMTPEVVYAAIETMQQDHGVKPVLILVDYMQLIPIAGAADRMQAVTEVPIRVKELAMRVGCPAMLAVQASRDVDKRDEQIPTMADAQWASSIEQTCDKVFGLWRPWQTQGPNKPVEINGQTYQNAANLLVLRMLKQRFENGRWTWALYFDPALLRLAELEIRDDQAGRGWEPD